MEKECSVWLFPILVSFRIHLSRKGVLENAIPVDQRDQHLEERYIGGYLLVVAFLENISTNNQSILLDGDTQINPFLLISR